MTASATGSRGTASKKRSPIMLALAGLLIAYLPQYVDRILDWFGIQLGLEGPPSVIVWNWLAVGLLTAFIIGVERRSLASILLGRPQAKDLAWAGLFWVIATAWNWTMNIVVAPEAQNEGLQTIIRLPASVLLGMIVTTAVTEEILYKGYPIERVGELTGNRWLGAAFSLIVFVLPHVSFFGVQWLLYHGAGTILAYVLYMWRRNLWACIFMHFLGNAPLLVPALGLA